MTVVWLLTLLSVFIDKSMTGSLCRMPMMVMSQNSYSVANFLSFFTRFCNATYHAVTEWILHIHLLQHKSANASLPAYDEAVPRMQYLPVDVSDKSKRITDYSVLISLFCTTSHFHFYAFATQQCRQTHCFRAVPFSCLFVRPFVWTDIVATISYECL